MISLKQLQKIQFLAIDDYPLTVKDIIFEPLNWQVHWVQVSVQYWLVPRKRVIPADWLQFPAGSSEIARVKQTREEILAWSDDDIPPTAQQQVKALMRNNSFPRSLTAFWPAGLQSLGARMGQRMRGADRVDAPERVVAAQMEEVQTDNRITQIDRDVSTLRSGTEVMGYQVWNESDRRLMLVRDLWFEPENWKLRHLSLRPQGNPKIDSNMVDVARIEQVSAVHRTITLSGEASKAGAAGKGEQEAPAHYDIDGVGYDEGVVVAGDVQAPTKPQ